MKLDSEIVAARSRQAEAFPPFDFAALPPEQARRRGNQAGLFLVDGKPDLPRIEDMSIPGAAGAMRARLYRPVHGRSGAILYLHGGGWFHCNIDLHDRLMRSLAQASGLAVLGIDYRLAPEHPYPAGLDDSIAAWRWLNQHAAGLGLDPEFLLVAGDSAGANLALALCVAERDASRALPHGAALFYGCYAPLLSTDSHLRCGDGTYGLTTERMRWYWTQYVGADFENAPPGAAPLRAELRGLPPIYLNLAELDPLADDTRLLAAVLAAANVPYALHAWPGASHGFLQLTRDVALARRAMDAAGAWLRKRASP